MTELERRELLKAIGAAGTFTIAGCSDYGNPSNSTQTNDSDGNNVTSAPRDDNAPTILSYNAVPQDYGDVLAVSMEGSDGKGIEYASISYGDLEMVETPGAEQASLKGVLEGVPDAEAGDPGHVKYLLRDSSGNETEAEAYPDRQAPEIAVVANTPETAEEIETVLEGKDNVGLHELEMLLNGEQVLEQDLTGQKTVSQERDLTGSIEAMKPGEKNSVEAYLEDALGNTSRKKVEQYVRKYDNMEETEYDIGAHFIPQAGGMVENDCDGNREFTGVTLQDPIQPETVSYWTDQLTGHGIGRLIYSYEGFRESPERLRTFVESDLLDQVTVEPEISWNTFNEAMKYDQDWEKKLDRITSLFQETIMDGDNLAKYEDRPIVRMGSTHVFFHDEPRQIIQDNWDDYDSFFNDIRSQLTVDGKEPFLIGGMWGGVDFGNSEFRTLAQQFDALSNWFPPVNKHAGETYRWEEAYPDLEEYMRNLHDFATENDLEYIPTAMAGEDDRGNDCWGPEGKRHIPISLEWFGKVLELAENYATTDMIDLATVNDIGEGHELVASKHGDTDYGTDRLEVVEQFQSQ